MSSAEAKNEEKISRRRLLRSAMLFSAVGAGIILGVDSIARAVSSSTSGGGTTSNATSPASSSDGSTTSASSLRVKAMYFQMPQITSDKEEEYFILQSPARLGDLLSNVVEEHPLISAMMPTMMILIDGVPGRASTPLKNGDEVDFVPAIAGG